MKNNFKWVRADKEEWGSEVYWLLPEYSSTTKEVKSGAIGCQQTDLYTLRNNRVTVLRTSQVHVDVTKNNREISNA